MPGRQAHGRPLLSKPKAPGPDKRSKARSRKKALDAFGIAQQQYAAGPKLTPRVRELDAHADRKHERDEGGEEEGGLAPEEEADSRRRKRPRPAPGNGDDAEYGSDSEGNEWKLGGLADNDDDSEIESDDAFGESDNDKFDGYAFRGTKTRKAPEKRGNDDDDDDDEEEDDADDDEGRTLGPDAIDLATALDNFQDDSDPGPEEQTGSLPGPSDAESSSDESGSSDEEDGSDRSEEDDEDGDEADPQQLDALHNLVSLYGGEETAEKQDGSRTKKHKVNLGDLGLKGLSDTYMEKSVKLLKKEASSKRPTATKKLQVPLHKRGQDRLDRAAAYEKTNQTLDRWTETVKLNRRAEHLVFPLPENSATKGLDMDAMAPLSAKNAATELESTVLSIMSQSGLSTVKVTKAKPREYDDEGNPLSRKEAQNRKRLQRELNDREAKRTKRIKKIKSKAYHRVHRKQRERDEMAAQEARQEAGEIDSEEEREAQDRRRALERVGQRHKESKWAKLGAKTKRAVWDDDFRAGLSEMAQRNEDLRRRKEARASGRHGSDSDTSSSGSSSDEEEDDEAQNAALRRQLDELDQAADEAPSGLMGMKFMRKAEEAQRQANDEMISQIRRELDGEEADEADEAEGGDGADVGRRSYGTTAKSSAPKTKKTVRSTATVLKNKAGSTTTTATTRGRLREKAADIGGIGHGSTAESTAGAWSRGEKERRKPRRSEARTGGEDLDLRSVELLAAAAEPPAEAREERRVRASVGDDEDEDEDARPTLRREEQDLVARAFAGEDVVADFAREKAEMAAADDDKTIDSTLPGWGSWVGEGVSRREKRRHQGRFLTRTQGIKPEERKDAKLERVMMSEKRIKKNDRYLASQLPHPFESREQYERSLRLPLGPEWITKESFQEATKPRLLLQPGLIAPMSKPRA